MKWGGAERGCAVEGELCFIQADIEEDPLDNALDILEALREKFSPTEAMAAIDAAGLRDATHTHSLSNKHSQLWICLTKL